MDKLKELHSKREALEQELDAILAQENPDGAALDRGEAINVEIRQLDRQITLQEQRAAELDRQARATVTPHEVATASGGGEGTPQIDVPIRGNVRNFEDAKEAYRFGQWALAVRGNQRSAQYCRDNGIELRTLTEGSATAGGSLVPEEFDPRIVYLIERRGTFRRNANIVPMAGDTKVYNKQTSGMTAYHVAELTAPTASDSAFQLITLTAKKIMAMTTLSTELNEDSVVSVGDIVAGDIAQAFATREDADGWMGDGTAAYGDIQGVEPLLTAATAGLVNGASGSATDWSKITLGDFSEMLGKLPDFVNELDLKWYCSRAFYFGVMDTLLNAAGGNTMVNLQGGAAGIRFLGYPVEFVGDLPKTAAAPDIVCMLGDLRKVVDMGDRRGRTVRFVDNGTIGSVNLLTQDAIGVVASERYAITVHSVGDTTNAGPIVGLLTAS